MSTFDGIKLYFSASNTPSDVILEGLYKSKLQDTAVLPLYDQETVRKNGQTSFLRNKTSVKLHVGQMMTTRNFSVQNEVVERGSVTKSQKGKKACVERKVGECFQGKAHGQCSKGDSCSFSHDRLAQGDLCSGQRRKGRSHQIRRPRLTKEEKNPLQAQECGRNCVSYSYCSKDNARTHFEKTRGARIRGRFRSISAHAEQKRIKPR